jgi:hypothetical protein
MAGQTSVLRVERLGHRRGTRGVTGQRQSRGDDDTRGSELDGGGAERNRSKTEMETPEEAS